MNKKYIILTNAIVNLGGGQIYCNNKKKYLRSIGYEPFVFSTHGGKIYIKELEEFLPLIINELNFHPIVFDQQGVDKVLNLICEKIDYNSFDDIIIESNTPYLSVWGELLAKKIKAKHVVYLLGEMYSFLDDFWFGYFEYKYNRKELANINQLAMKKMFAPYKNIPIEKCFGLDANLGNPVDDIKIPHEYMRKCKGKKVIGVIGRGDKKYVFESVKNSCLFASYHIDEKFVLILVGSVIKGISEKIKDYIGDYHNIELIMTGDQFPIPKKLLQLMDVCFAGAGCVLPPYMESVPTISMDVYDNNPIGVMGYDTTEIISRKTDKYNSSTYYLEEILYGSFLLKNDFLGPSCDDFHMVYDKHMDFIINSSKEKEYYKFSNMVTTKKEKVYSLFYKTGGIKAVLFIEKIMKIMKGKR